MVDRPSPVKDGVMFGSAGSHALRQPRGQSRGASDRDPRHRQHLGRRRARRGRAPTRALHYRQAEHDALWIVSPEEVAAFANAHSASPHRDAAMIRGTGPCMDFHRVGAALQLQQLGFALRCAASAA